MATAVIALPLYAAAEEMTSTNYKLNPDVIGSSGGEMSSPSYKVNATSGQAAAGALIGASGATYAGYSGFWNTATLGIVQPVGSMQVDGGATYASTAAGRTLTFSPTTPNGAITEIMLSNDGVFDTETWAAYSASMPWALTSGDGSKTVYAMFKDTTGIVSEVSSDAIILDTTAPTGGSLTATPANYQIDLSWSGFSDAQSGIIKYKLLGSTGSVPADCSSGTVLLDNSSATSYAVAGTVNGTAYYYRVCAADEVGNMSAGVTGSATPTAPAGVSYVAYDNGSSGSNDTLPGLSRKDNGKDSDNSSTGSKPKVDIEYTFSIVVQDPGGTPQSVTVYISNKSNPTSAADYQAYTMTCTGSYSAGALCTFTTKLGPQVVNYYFETVLNGGSTVAQGGSGVPNSGPTVGLLTGYNIIGIPRNINAFNLDGGTNLGESHTYRWKSTGLAASSGSYERVDDVANPGLTNYLKYGEGYFMWHTGTSPITVPELALYADVPGPTVTLTLSQGWNIISNPYIGNVLLSGVKVQKNAETPVSWSAATGSNWLANAIYYYNGSDWGSTYTSESAGGTPNATLVPFIGYWVYVKDSSATYKLVITKP
ncbi:MAG: hypothetical protein OEV59_01725 [Deltaproteobacteria bacterium]|nr:hypothetical protein [Deltaproteobacteria bacterium]